MKIQPIFLNYQAYNNKNACREKKIPTQLVFEEKFQKNNSWGKYLQGTLVQNNISFGYTFKLKDISDLPCAYCGKRALTLPEIKRLTTYSGEKLADTIIDYIGEDNQVLSNTAQKALSKICDSAYSNPSLSAENLISHVFKKSRKKYSKTRQEDFETLKSAIKHAKEPHLLNYVQKLQDNDPLLNPKSNMEELTRYYQQNGDGDFKNNVMCELDALRKKNKHKKEEYKNIEDAVNAFGVAKNNANAYLIKHISRTKISAQNIGTDNKKQNFAEVFFKDMFAPMISSAEHIDTNHNGGIAHYSNFLVTHSRCNALREQKPWLTFLNENEGTFDNVIEYLNIVRGKNYAGKGVDKGYVQAYIDQVSRQIQTILEQGNKDEKSTEYLTKIKQFRKKVKEDSCLRKVATSANEEGSRFIQPRINSAHKKSIAEQFGKLVDSNNEQKTQKQLERTLKEEIAKLKAHRQKLYSGIFENLDPQADKAICNYIYYLQEEDKILNLEHNNFDGFKELFATDFETAIRQKLDKKINKLYPTKDQRDPKKLALKTFSYNLQPTTSIYGSKAKILLSIREGKEKYDLQALKTYIEN